MKIITSMLFMLTMLIPTVTTAAVFNNCSSFLNKTGYVSSVSVGVDNKEAPNISFSIMINNIYSGQISVKQTLNDNSGKGMLETLLKAFGSSSELTIERCYDNQVAGVTISRKE
ncbi:hypothetical protein; putative exported protein (plasmid) [Xenorhabdus nematophila ATCC 19061]|uniref:Uncharacterized protein n=1 Tax=Xenorhabdus nematophila (strain ATCC 19061 / DSM 3370 / CCUG 14189 / LMG 1036 / NCIMB 9965 / AN6) TaxID=406817 RepID=D3VLZ3_XENNA|nr:hypothetical protein [Xenorhabdus nematophila]CBJ92945.1 hypothetical protein; putative exported protein [Xenorhabdus nematophila ATCC 19061]CEK25560.1 conserved exported protein of unknown function [Xenorhabdus nematophila AN6/1]